MCLLSLEDTHLEVYRVANDVHLGRLQVVEQVSVVPIHVAHGILVFGESLAQQLLVIHVALLEVEQAAQVVGAVDGVAHPCDVAHIVFLAFVNLHVDVHVLVVDVPHAVLQYHGIAVAVFVVLLYEVLLVRLPVLGSELL